MPPSKQIAVNFVEIAYDGVLGPFLDGQEDTCRLVLMEDMLLSIRVRLQQLGERITTLRNLCGQQTCPI